MLEPVWPDSYCSTMKRFFCAAIILMALGVSPLVRGQDAALEERLNKLSGQIEDLRAAREADQKRFADLTRELENVREQAAKPNASYASQEDLRRMTEKVQELDKNREHDKELILKEINKLGKAVAVPSQPARKAAATGDGSSPAGVPTATPPSRRAPLASADNPGSASHADAKPADQQKGYEYIIKQGDTLSVIVQAYHDQNIKVTVDQILKANPGLKAEKLHVGQKIFIPEPQ
jgi:LysM repeat protein